MLFLVSLGSFFKLDSLKDSSFFDSFDFLDFLLSGTGFLPSGSMAVPFSAFSTVFAIFSKSPTSSPLNFSDITIVSSMFTIISEDGIVSENEVCTAFPSLFTFNLLELEISSVVLGLYVSEVGLFSFLPSLFEPFDLGSFGSTSLSAPFLRDFLSGFLSSKSTIPP
uniref:Uncharacterized protein n=1 Tax=Cacopsylla melanoneura TaxID=428564 RepID=A0A8D8MAQ4_9HEMI